MYWRRSCAFSCGDCRPNDLVQCRGTFSPFQGRWRGVTQFEVYVPMAAQLPVSTTANTALLTISLCHHHQPQSPPPIDLHAPLCPPWQNYMHPSSNLYTNLQSSVGVVARNFPLFLYFMVVVVGIGDLLDGCLWQRNSRESGAKLGMRYRGIFQWSFCVTNVKLLFLRWTLEQELFVYGQCIFLNPLVRFWYTSTSWIGTHGSADFFKFQLDI